MSDIEASPLAEVEVIVGPEVENGQRALAEIPSLLERAFEDSKRDGEPIVAYTLGQDRDNMAFEGIVVAYDDDYVALVENPNKRNTQQNLVARSAIIGLRSKYNMLAHVEV